MFDTSSIIYRGDGDKAEEILDYGFSKEKRFDLKQVVIGVLMSKQGIPLGHFVYPGNTNDFTALDNMLKEAREKFPIRRVVFVFDKGMTSQKNLEPLSANGDEYIAVVRVRSMSAETQDQLLDESDMETVSKKFKAKAITIDDQRYIVCYSTIRAKLDKQKRDEIIARLKENLKSKGLKILLISKEYAKYVTITAEKPTINKERIEREKLFDGKFVLTTNNQDLAPAEVVWAYKDLQKVERAFRTLKDELEIGPIYHYTEKRIRAHIMVAFLSLVLRVILEKKLKETDKNLSYIQVMADIRKIKAVRFQVKTREYVMRTEIQGQAFEAFKALSMKPPSRILEQHEEHTQFVVEHFSDASIIG